MPKKPTLGAQIDATIEGFLRSICDYVELRHQADPNDRVRRPTNSQLIREMCIRSNPKVIVDSLYPPPRVQIADNPEGESCADTLSDEPLTINHPHLPDVPTVFPEPKPPVNVTPTPTPIKTGRRHLRNTLIFGLCLSVLILALSANRDTEGGSALAKENKQLHARLAAIDAAAQDQAAKDAKTIEDLRAKNTELRDKLMTWEKKEPLIVARLKADTETIANLSRENAAIKSTHTRFEPKVAGNP